MDKNLKDIKTVLIVGSGGREHAIGYKIKQDNPNVELFFAPGNGGTKDLGTNLKISHHKEVVDFAEHHEVDLTIVGPEAELVAGIVDDFKSKQIEIFGPNKACAKLEGSKAFAKEFMQKYGVKNAKSETFKHYVDARDYVKKSEDYPLVVKASGLAAGKGVVICHDEIEAEKALKKMMLDKSFGDAGEEVLIEEYLEGFEASILSIFNKKEITPFISAKDHKKVGEGDTGLNTGGMGVVAPNPDFTDVHWNEFKNQIMIPTQKGLLEEGMYFSGVIFFGLMVTEKGVYLLEYNMRFGDPETQAVLPLLKSNLLEIIMKSNRRQDIHLEWKEQHACTVVMTSGGYPLNYDTGYVVRGWKDVEDHLYISGAKKHGDDLITSGGRVLAITGLGDNLEQAKKKAYHEIKKINFDYEYYREDIGE